jgi:alpha-L-arabinofuranosidase
MEVTYWRPENDTWSVNRSNKAIIQMRTITLVLIISSLISCTLKVAEKEYHVSSNGNNGNPGTKSRPFKTISAAAAVAQPGDTITVNWGTYRERVNPRRGGLSDTERITFRAAKGEKVIIKGSEEIKGWKQIEDGLKS